MTRFFKKGFKVDTKWIDLTGKRFGLLVAEEYLKPGKWRCRCDCGRQKIVIAKNLRQGITRSCGCLSKTAVTARNKSKRLHLSGKYGRLTTIRELDATPSGIRWEFLCDCGNTHVALASHVKRGVITSCGCYFTESVRKRMTGVSYCRKYDFGGLSGAAQKRAYIRMRYRTDPDFKAKIYALQSRRETAVRSGDLTRQQWHEIVDCFQHRCAYCSIECLRLTKDHMTPLSKDGLHTWSNIVPACRSCNSKKSKASFERAMREHCKDRDFFYAALARVCERIGEAA